MMLSSEDIRRAIESGALQVSPLFEDSVRPAGLGLHLGEQLLRPLPGKVVDVKRKIMPDYEEITLRDDGPYPLEAGGFVLGATFEKVSVGEGLGFLIEGRSTLARLGLTVVQTAMLVYPGHRERAVTLELANNGPNTILLYPRMKIARVALFELKSPTKDAYDIEGKYREQENVGPPIFKNEVPPNPMDDTK
ncbi:MAG: dCTP deaminase [Bdellovibrionales bacterium]|nr:dCTP deaminase [Bdellovibrionales bacterium]